MIFDRVTCDWHRFWGIQAVFCVLNSDDITI